MVSFFCDNCGICCKLFNLVNLPKEYHELNDGTGKCKYLNNNLCSIYEMRPLLCNSYLTYMEFYEKLYSWEEYEKLMQEQCNMLKNKYGRYFNND